MKRQQAEIGIQKNVNSIKIIFTMSAQALKRLSQEAGGSPSIEILKTNT